MQKVSGLALLPIQVLKLFPEQLPRPRHSPVPHTLHVPARAPLVVSQHSKSIHGADLAEMNLSCTGSPCKICFFSQISAISWVTIESLEHWQRRMQWGGIVFGRRAVHHNPHLIYAAVTLLPTASVGMVFQQICTPSLPLQDTLSLKTSKEHKPAFPKEPMKIFTRVEKFGRKILEPHPQHTPLSWALLARLTVTLWPLPCLPSGSTCLVLQTTPHTYLCNVTSNSHSSLSLI